MPESIGLAKSAPQPETIQPEVPKEVAKVSQTEYRHEGLPISIYKYFNIDLATTDDKSIAELKTIFEWASSDNQTMGDVLQKINTLENKLGAPRIGEMRFSKMYNWIRLQNIVDKMLRPTNIEQKIEDLKKQQNAFVGGK